MNPSCIRVSHSISGCVEAPIQLVMNSFLVMKGILGIPWWESTETKSVTDTAGNKFTFYSIPLWTLIFSLIDILKCTVLTNIFNVYIGKISSWNIFKKYVNLIFGQLPFFLHAILFRVLSYSFLVVYLNEYHATATIFLVWLSNLVIGYAMTSDKQAKRDINKIKSKLTRMKSIVHREAEMPRVETVSSKSNATLISSTPIWLNSFFSIMVPTCSVNIIDPHLVNRNEGNERLQRQFYKFNKDYQKRAMRKLLIASNFIILVSVGIVWYRINFSGWGYNANIYGNIEFNILCAVLFIMGIISMVFMKTTDVYELFGLNNGEKEPTRREEIEMTQEGTEGARTPTRTNKCKVLIKMMVTITCLVFVLGYVSDVDF